MVNPIAIVEIFSALEEHSEGHILKVSLFSTFLFMLITIPDIDIAFYKRVPPQYKDYKYYLFGSVFFFMTFFGYKFVFSLFDNVLMDSQVLKDVKKKNKEE